MTTNNPSVVYYLQTRSTSLHRVLSAKGTPELRLGGDKPLNPLEGAIAVDVALAELGDKGAQARVEQLFRQPSVEEMSILFRYLKFVNNFAVLRGTVQQLKNRTVVTGHPVLTGMIVEDARVCDIAMLPLCLRFEPSKARAYEVPRRFTDAELNAAFADYKAKVPDAKDAAPPTKPENGP